jgi:positive regulator of sigma E activity
MSNRQRFAWTRAVAAAAENPEDALATMLAKLFCSTPRTFRIPNAEHRSVGERVRISIVNGSVGRSALHAYVFPLLMLLAGALSGSALGDEAGAIGGSIAGLLIGWLGLRQAQRRSRRDPRLQPSIGP